MTSFFFSRTSLSKNNNNNNNNNSKTLNSSSSSPSALWCTKKKHNALLVMKARTRIFCLCCFPTKNKEKTKKRKNVSFSHVEYFITLISILTVYSTQCLSKKRHPKSSSSQIDKERNTPPIYFSKRELIKCTRSCAPVDSAFFQQKKDDFFVFG